MNDAGIGTSYSNVALKDKDIAQLYCVPADLILNGQDYVNILNKSTEEYHE